jgi:DNA-binding NarL/FixJ family response regulator
MYLTLKLLERGLRPFSRNLKGGNRVQGFAKQRAVVLHAYPLWREALTDVLEGLGFEVVLTADSEEDALAAVRDANADLLVTGTSEELDGVDCVRQARRVATNVRVAVVAPDYDAEQAEAALSAGAYVYIVESAHPDDVRAAIRQGFDTSVFLGSGETSAAPPAVRPAPKTQSHSLTKREQEILKLVSEGRSNGEVARQLWVTEQTVKFHLSNIYRKLGVTNRTEAGRQAQLIGLLDDDSTRESVGG